jgi:hypothetical protein
MNIQDATTLDLLRELERRGHYCPVFSIPDVELLLEELDEAENLTPMTEEQIRHDLALWRDEINSTVWDHFEHILTYHAS